MTLPSDDELAAIEARANAATSGPWKLSEPQGNWIWPHVCNTYGSSRADAEFIAHSRADVPALLAHIAALGEKYAAATRFAEAYMAWVDEFHALPPTSTDFERIEIARDLMHDAEDAYRKAGR